MGTQQVTDELRGMWVHDPWLPAWPCGPGPGPGPLWLRVARRLFASGCTEEKPQINHPHLSPPLTPLISVHFPSCCANGVWLSHSIKEDIKLYSIIFPLSLSTCVFLSSSADSLKKGVGTNLPQVRPISQGAHWSSRRTFRHGASLQPCSLNCSLRKGPAGTQKVLEGES